MAELWEKIKGYVAGFGAVVVAVLAFIFVRRGEKVEELEHENNSLKTDKEVQQKQEELNEIHKQVENKETELDHDFNDFAHSKAEFERLRDKLSNDKE
jgi:uncharacterized protein YlxW (UPF0749 family)